jgi:hypothetical protein
MICGNSERLEKASGLSRRLLALLVGLLATVTLIASGAPSAAAQTRVEPQPQNLILAVGAQATPAPDGVGVHALPLRPIVSATGVAADTAGSLAPDVAKTFSDGAYTQVTTKGRTTLYRVYGGSAKQLGAYWTTSLPSDSADAVSKLALDPA